MVISQLVLQAFVTGVSVVLALVGGVVALVYWHQYLRVARIVLVAENSGVAERSFGAEDQTHG